MAKRVQLRRGTTAQTNTFTGAVGEVTVDTTKKTLVVHDGVTTGGFPLTSSGAVRKQFGETAPVGLPLNYNFNNIKVGDFVYYNKDYTTATNKPPFEYCYVFAESSGDERIVVTAREAATGKVASRAYVSGSWSAWNIVTFEKDVLGGTYKDVTSSRLSGVTYTNTSGKSIVLKVLASYFATNASEISIYIDSIVGAVNLGTMNIRVQTRDISIERYLIVPNNSPYSFTVPTTANFSYKVLELS